MGATTQDNLMVCILLWALEGKQAVKDYIQKLSDKERESLDKHFRVEN